ncbi:MAG: MarR family transcriptional regulator [Anaerolineales bacterium]|jgi:DNA-binding MarR family transcriptional regulator
MVSKSSIELTHELFQVMKSMRRLKWRPEAPKDLTRSEYELLGLLAILRQEEHRPPTVTEISACIQTSPAAVTHLVNSLEESGFIERQRASEDRRVVQIGLTESGLARAETLMGEAQSALSDLVEYLGEEDSKTLVRLMSKMVAYFSAATSDNS